MVGQPLENVDLVRAADDLRIDSPRQSEARDQCRKREQESAQHGRPHRAQRGALVPQHKPSQPGSHHRPAADEHVKRRCPAEQQPRPIPTTADQGFQPQEDQHVGEPLGLDPPDDPLAGHLVSLQQAHEQGGREHGKPWARDEGVAQPAPGPGQQPPRQQAPDPGQRSRREPEREPSEREVKDLVRVGGVEKRVVGDPIGVPEVDRLAQVIRLVDVGDGPSALEEQDGEHQRDLRGGHPPSRPPGRRRFAVRRSIHHKCPCTRDERAAKSRRAALTPV